MKKILILACLCTSAVSYGQVVIFKKQQPTTENEAVKKEVPKAVTFITSLPIIKKIGNSDVSYIHDPFNNALILFKGNEDSILKKLLTHLQTQQFAFDSSGRQVLLTPIGVFIETPIEPFTLFTDKELKKYKKENRDMMKKLEEYRTYSITYADYTTLDQLTPGERQLLASGGKSQQQQNGISIPMQQNQQNQRNSTNNNTNTQQRRSVLDQYNNGNYY